MSTPGIVLAPGLTSELVEFWGFKYKEVKEELEALKKAEGLEDSTLSYGELRRMVQKLQSEAFDTARRLEANEKYLHDLIASTRNEQQAAQHKLAACNAEKADLFVRLARSDNERLTLYHQVEISYSQAASLAAEADRQRMAIVAELFPATSFFADTFTPLIFNSAKRVVRGLPQDSSNPQAKLYFLPRPPASTPLRVPAACQCGYWFYPFNLSTEAPFDLIVEVGSDTWLYFGRYQSRLLPGYEMKISEWITLDEEVKLNFCTRVASQRGSVGQHASHAAQVDIRQRYDSGQWNIPCYTLQCVGFNMTLHDTLIATASKIEIPDPPSLGKRLRTETPSRYGSAAADESASLAKRVRRDNSLDDVDPILRVKRE
ncbi:hypothetical protein DFH09DRAFT_1353457 [Mycena vulgaris]|nr:hypothetical protein DFH09DRAFT_1353457 [Mycena vulgaris]